MDNLIQKITQLGIVVSDIYAAIDRYEKVYGLGPWTIADGSEGLDDKYQAVDLTTRGKRQDFRVSLAWCMAGEVQLELIQPHDDLSDYGIFLRDHGEGVHHIEITTDVPAFRKKMQERGIPELMSGRIPGVERWIYFDTGAELGMTVEIHDKTGGGAGKE